MALKDIKIEDLLYLIEPSEPVSILVPIEEEAMDEANDGKYMLHNVYGPCYVYEETALDLFVSTPKVVLERDIATIESIMTKDHNAVVPAIRIIMKEEDKVTYREEELNGRKES